MKSLHWCGKNPMKIQFHKTVFAAALVAMLGLSHVSACLSCTDFPDLVTTLGSSTKTAVASGNYNLTTTWGGLVPSLTDVVVIPDGVTVTITNTAATARSIIVKNGGRLKFATAANTKLRVETLAIDTGGALTIGDDANPIAAANTAEISILGDTNIPLDPARLARGIVARTGSTIRMVSASQRPPFVTLKNNVGPSTTNFSTTAAIPSSWKQGDEIVIPAAKFTRQWLTTMPTAGTGRLQNETRTIGTIVGGANPYLTFTDPVLDKLDFQHLSADIADANIRVHVANLTRNIVLRSETSGADFDRSGHAMFMTNNVIIKGVRFENFGRTNKFDIASDPRVNTDTYNVPGGNRYSNPRGRYAVHFHKAGPDDSTIALVQNSVVVGTPGWGFVNHSSHVDFRNNVAFDFDGAGFAAEDGDEQGTFDGNIAIGGKGNGEFSILRTIFENVPRVDQGDMGFTGEGFWFQGPDVSVTNNIAAGCKGAGFLFWPAGRHDTLNALDANARGHVTGRPLGRLVPPGVAPRKWDYDGDGDADAYVLTDFPIKAFSGNTAYACLTGLKIRFCNHPSTETFTAIQGLDFSSEVMPADGKADIIDADRINFTVSNCNFWNNLNGVHGHYLAKCKFQNVKVIATAPRTGPFTAPISYALEAGQGAIGLDFHTQVGMTNSISFVNVLVKNYTTGFWREGLPNGNGRPLATGITYENCIETMFTDEVDPGTAKGKLWFDQILTTDNIPDNPQ
jgi:hypothetical protein